MTLREIKSYIDLISADRPDALDLPVEMEPHDVWKSYQMMPGCAFRWHKGKESIVFRLED